MHNSFQDRENLYLTMDYIGGGDLRFHLLHKQEPFTEHQAQFIIGCIVSSLEYIHSNNILHRDIKPENLIFDENGYLKITDFGISRVWKPDNCNETSGTPGYIAPEILMRQNYGVAVDYYALGIILYEIAMGRRPYKAKDRKELREQIMAKQVQIKVDDVPKGWSLEAIDLINRLIQRKPQNRIGVNGPQEVKDHIWLKQFPWQKLLNGEIDSPFKPPKNCIYNFNGKQLTEQSEIDKQNAILLRKDEVQELFKGYEFDQIKYKNTNQNSQNGTPFTSFISQNQNKTDSSNQNKYQQQSIQNSKQLSQLNYAQQSQCLSQIIHSGLAKQPTLTNQQSSFNPNNNSEFVDKLKLKLDNCQDNSKKNYTDNDEQKLSRKISTQQQHKSTQDECKFSVDQQYIQDQQHA